MSTERSRSRSDERNNTFTPNLRHSGPEWIREMLEVYYTTQFLNSSDQIQSSDKRPVSGSISSEGGIAMMNSLSLGLKRRVEVDILKFEISKTTFTNLPPGDNNLSTKLYLKVRYLMRDEHKAIEKTEFFVLKSPPERENDREMAALANVQRREIYFYTDVVPILNKWAKSQNVNIFIPVPVCYFGRVNRPFCRKAILDIELNFPQAETILVLEDLTAHGFRKRHYEKGLSVDETKATIHELAKIHSISWVMEQKSVDVGLVFKFAHKALEAAVVYDMLLYEEMQTLKIFLENHPNGKNILEHIVTIEAKLRGTLVVLMEPSPEPAPTTLTHMDCWVDNLVFRPRGYDENVDAADLGSERKTKIKHSRLECRILGWQMMGRGRPTHDLALLIITSMSLVDRQVHTDMLLQYYFQVFEDTASLFQHSLPFDVNCIREEYKTSKLLAVFFVIASIDLALSHVETQERLLAILEELINEDLI